MNVRPFGAAAVGAAGVAVLLAGQAPWPAALLAGAGAASFVAGRTLAGVWSGFGLLILAAAVTLRTPPAGAACAAAAIVPLLAGLEVAGLSTVAAVAMARDPRQISRRLLGSWLASSGAVVLGLALCRGGAGASAASSLVLFGLLYKLGAVPAYAWAPMLLRHPQRAINVAGAAGMVTVFALILMVTPSLPDQAAAARTADACAAVTIPWAAWKSVRQWRNDRRCAVTYAVVVLLSAAVLLAAG